jgi:hypothetical protein
MFVSLDSNYPKADDPEEVKKLIGGAVNAAWITNTCAIRMSRALNYSGMPLPAHFPGMNTIAGGDHKRYAFRMQELKLWVAHKFGKPTIDLSNPARGIDRDAFAGKRGIIVFDIHFSDANGHIDLWDGTTFIHERIAGHDYFAMATRVVLFGLA